MKDKRILRVLIGFSFVLFFMFGLVSPAAGSPYYQATATWDVKTPPSTPTAGGGVGLFNTSVPLEIDCPEGLPEGYGTVTPGAMWSYICQDCLPGEVTPTEWEWPTPGYQYASPLPPVCLTAGGGTPEHCMTLTPTTTVTHTVTPFATNTGTPVVCATPTVGLMEISWLNIDAPEANIPAWTVNVDCNPVEPVMSYDGSPETPPGGVLDKITCIYDVSGSHPGGGHHEILIHTQISNIPNPTSADMYARLTVLDADEYSQLAMGSCNSWGYEGLCGTSLDANVLGKDFETHVYIVNEGSGFNFHIQYKLEVSQYSDYREGYSCATSTPTLTPTPVGDEYCDVIDDGTIDSGDLPFWIPTGEMYCRYTPYVSTSDIYVYLQGWLLFFEWLPGFTQIVQYILSVIGEAGLPATTVCVQNYAFAVIPFFGVDINLNYIFGLLALAFLLRVLRSKMG